MIHRQRIAPNLLTAVVADAPGTLVLPPRRSFQLASLGPLPRDVHVILANINRNVLLQDVPAYSRHLKPGGLLVSSGYYRRDGELIETTFGQANLSLKKTMEENAWLSQLYVKE